jgi:DNA-binding transcriptional regulator YdaS (Cro superfamily)
VDAGHLRRALLLQRRLFDGGDRELADALGVSHQALSQFLKRRHAIPRRDCAIMQALGLEVATVKTLKPKDDI